MKYRTNGHEIDVGLRVVRHGADELHVEPQVFDLILYLIENRNRVVARDELLARVWRGRFVSDATIASRLNAARRVLGDDGRRQDVIKTLAKQGFRFMAPVSADGDKVGRPSIGVMPFALIESEDRDAHLARGLADQLSAALGQAAWFDVCDTAASFAPGLADLAPADIANDVTCSVAERRSSASASRSPSAGFTRPRARRGGCGRARRAERRGCSGMSRHRSWAATGGLN